MGSVLRFVTDKLQNVVAGLNTPRDKQYGSKWVLPTLTQLDIDSAYRGDWMVRKIHDIPPFDTVREWREWHAEEDAITKIEEMERKFCIQHKTMRALMLSRLTGGAVMVMGIDGAGSPESELDIEKVKQDSLKYLHVLHRWEITAGELNRNVLDPLYGEPKYYEVANSDMNAKVHPSRVIRFVSNPLPDTRNVADGWGDPTLQVINDAVMNAAAVLANVSSLTHEANVDVIRIPQFMESLATAGYTQKLLNRFQLAAIAKGNNGMLLLDKDEEYDRKELHFAALPDVIDRFLQTLSGAADIPLTRLLGQSPAGLNATGESDLRNYYDRLSADQKLQVDPALWKLNEVALRSTFGSRDPDIYCEWRPLWQESETEKVDNDKKRAETTQIYVNSNLLPPDALAVAVVNQLVERGTYPGLETAMAETGHEDPAEYALEKQEEEKKQADLEHEQNKEMVALKAGVPKPPAAKPAASY